MLTNSKIKMSDYFEFKKVQHPEGAFPVGLQITPMFVLQNKMFLNNDLYKIFPYKEYTDKNHK